MALTKDQLERIVEIIRRRFASFSYEALGERALTTEELAKLKSLGLLRSSVRSLTTDGYTLGKVVGLLEKEAVKGLGFEDVLAIAKSMSPITEVERHAMNFAADHAGQYIRGVADDMIKDVTAASARSGMTALKVIRDQVKTAILERKTSTQLASDLFHAIDNRTRDWRRVAFTELHDAVQHGVYEEIRNKSDDGANQLVYKRPSPDACFPAETRIVTQRGNIPIRDVMVGDMVLTHKVRWRRVNQKFIRQHSTGLVGVNGLWATPNHPFLADNNWTQAELLQHGQNVVRLFRVINSDDQPAAISQEPFFDGIPVTDSARIVPAATIDLYRDLQRRDSNINVEFVEGEFQHRLKTSLCKSNGNLLSAIVCVLRPIFLPSDRLSLLRHRGHRQLASFASLFSDCSFFFRAHLRKFCGLDFALGFEADSSLDQSSFERSLGNAKMTGDINQGGSDFGVSDDSGINIESCSVIWHDERLIAQPQKVNLVERRRFEGQVFNLSVEEDHSYFAEGVAVHNCKHCKRLYLRADGNPKVFRLHELEISNVGRKANEWGPVVGSTHPWCLCQIVVIPEGYDFVKKRAVSEPFEHDGKTYRRGTLITEDDYANLPSEHQAKIGSDSVLAYTGRTAAPEVEKSLSLPVEDDGCVCEY